MGRYDSGRIGSFPGFEIRTIGASPMELGRVAESKMWAYNACNLGMRTSWN